MLLTESDCPCTKSELSLFDPRPLQTVLNSAHWVDVHPLNSVSQGTAPIEFSIVGSPDEYLDLNDTMLHIRCRILKPDGTAFTAEDAQRVAPVNNWLHSIFSDVKLIVGDKQLEGGVHLYAYRALLSNLLLFSKSVKKTHLSASGFAKDTAGQMDSIDRNWGHTTRLGSVNNSKSVDLCGPLWLDLFTQSKYLLNLLDVHIKLVRAKPDFCLFGGEGRLVIDDAILYVRRVKVEPSIILEHDQQLLTRNAIYPIQHTEMSTYTISAGNMSNNKEGLFRGHMPKMVIIGMVDNKAYNGSLDTNPFNFKHFELNHLALYRDGTCIPFRPLTPSFPTRHCVREYMTLVQSLEQFNRNDDFGISLTDYILNGYVLFGFNLTPDLSICGHAQPYREGNLRLELRFEKALEQSINVIVMAIFDGKVEITRQRNVLLDYKG